MIPLVLDAVRELNPQSILDVGAGAGKYGVLFREYLDICLNGTKRECRTRRIDAVEAFDPYVGDLHRAVYDNIFIDRVESLLDRISAYDIVFLGDVIEHFAREQGEFIITELWKRTNIAMLVVTPAGFLPQETWGGNELERHLSYWRKKDFHSLGRVLRRGVGYQSLFVITRPGVTIRCLAKGTRLQRWTLDAGKSVVRGVFGQEGMRIIRRWVRSRRSG